MLPYVLSHQFRGWRAALALFLGVAPDGVYICPICHHTGGELLPRLFTLTTFVAVIFCCTFLKVTLTGRYPASLLYGARTFLVRCLATLLYATVRFTLCIFVLFFYIGLLCVIVGSGRRGRRPLQRLTYICL